MRMPAHQKWFTKGISLCLLSHPSISPHTHICALFHPPTPNPFIHPSPCPPADSFNPIRPPSPYSHCLCVCPSIFIHRSPSTLALFAFSRPRIHLCFQPLSSFFFLGLLHFLLLVVLNIIGLGFCLARLGPFLLLHLFPSPHFHPHHHTV